MREGLVDWKYEGRPGGRWKEEEDGGGNFQTATAGRGLEAYTEGLVRAIARWRPRRDIRLGSELMSLLSKDH